MHSSLKYLAIFCFFLFFSCGVHSPTEHEMREKQQSYEDKKRSLEANKGQFFLENKEALFEQYDYFIQAIDTTKRYDEINNDTNFVYEKPIVEISPSLDANTKNISNGSEGYLKLVKHGGKYSNLPEILTSLKNCKESGNDLPCKSIPENAIKNFLNIDMLITEQVVLDIPAKLKSDVVSESFESGMKLSFSTCRKVREDRPFFSYITTAQNTESIYITEGDEEYQLQSDLERNFILESIKSKQKHFKIN